MPNVAMPNGDIVAFPDDMPREQIKGLIAGKFPEIGGLTPNRQAAPQDTGVGRTALEQGLQGATFGFGDEVINPLGAAASALYENPTGFAKSVLTGKIPEVSPELSESISGVEQETKDRMQAQVRERPVLSIGSNIAGALGTGVAGASTKAGTAVANSLRSGGALARIGKGAIAGAASSGLYGAGTADEGQRLEGAANAALPSPNKTLGENLLSGAAIGAAIPAAGAVIGGAKNAILPKVTDIEVRKLAKEALDEGIPLSRSQIGDSRFAKTLSSATKSIPFSGSGEFAQKQLSAFNRAVLSKAGIAADKATPEVLSNAADNFGKRFTNLTAKTIITVDDDLLDQIAEVEAQAGRRLGKDATRTIGSYIDDILESGGRIDGRIYQNTRSELGRLAKSTNDTLLSKAYKSMQSALDDAAFKALPASGKQEWLNVRKQYAAFKVIQKAVTNSGELAAVGNISPAQLAIATKSGTNYAMGAGELNKLARIGTRFIKDAIPDSGTAGRLGAYATLMGAPGAILGGAPGALLSPAAGVGLARGFNALNTAQPIVRGALNGGRSVAPLLSVPAAVAAGNLSNIERTPARQPARLTITPQDKLPDAPAVELPQVAPQSNAAPAAQEDLFARVIQQESGGKQTAVSRKGAVGVAQLMPRTAPEAAQAAGLLYDFKRFVNDPEYNAALGKAYLNKMLKKYDGDETHALMAYNWGPGNVDRWIRSGSNPKSIPDETRDYVVAILQ